jgi:hypothetical protein
MRLFLVRQGIVGRAVTLYPRARSRPRRTLLVTSKSLDKRSCPLHLKARETEYIPLVKLTPMVLEIDHRDLPNSVGRGHVCTGESVHIGPV